MLEGEQHCPCGIIESLLSRLFKELQQNRNLPRRFGLGQVSLWLHKPINVVSIECSMMGIQASEGNKWSKGFLNLSDKESPFSFILSCLLEQLPPDQHPPDLARPRPDLVELGVPQKPPRRVVVDVAVAAEKLDRVERHL